MNIFGIHISKKSKRWLCVAGVFWLISVVLLLIGSATGIPEESTMGKALGFIDLVALIIAHVFGYGSFFFLKNNP